MTMVIKMKKKTKKYSILSYNIIIIILCFLLLGIACYITYDKYLGPTYNWFKYQEKHKIQPNCDNEINKELEKNIKIKDDEFNKVLTTYNNAKELINSDKLLSSYVDVKINKLSLSCKKIQKDLLTIYFSDELIETILKNFTLNNEFVDCQIKDSKESYGPRNIFSNTIFQLNAELNLIPLAYDKEYFLTLANDNYLIFKKSNDVWKIDQY